MSKPEQVSPSYPVPPQSQVSGALQTPLLTQALVHTGSEETTPTREKIRNSVNDGFVTYTHMLFFINKRPDRDMRYTDTW